MMKSAEKKKNSLTKLIAEELKPYVKKIDTEAFYAEDYLRTLGKVGLFSAQGRTEKEQLIDEYYMVKETAKICMTTAFCLWCHLAALTYIRHSENEHLKATILPKLESGALLGATALSNPLKYFAGLETMHLKAEKTEGGYFISGVIPYVSNLGEVDHGFGFIAAVNDSTRIIGFLSCETPGITMKERKDYFGLNGSATYACTLKKVFIADDCVISENADEFVNSIKSIFIAYQIPLGFGVVDASVQSIEKVNKKQNGCNQYLPIQADQLKERLAKLEGNLRQQLEQPSLSWRDIAEIRLEIAYLTLDAVQAAMLHHGGSAYLKDSTPARKLREAYFLANLTPTIKHLEKMLVH
ncbi:acyl-CoA dehydrogenase family protein [Lederbergia galactosidilytica]|uniref:Acyl-CoA dehydrogenase n=2 Tax=Lederbergia galactosidilytica TaxID=217031 RepID=A0A177ZMS8_9BACI|nr:acyl-CoA dehydrogenase family protein [Lederbergia galactosidilytica]OAK69084.1 acyl-CoA dehydrogenase [Lederbergia galactosidilytica]